LAGIESKSEVIICNERCAPSKGSANSMVQPNLLLKVQIDTNLFKPCKASANSSSQ